MFVVNDILNGHRGIIYFSICPSLSVDKIAFHLSFKKLSNDENIFLDLVFYLLATYL